MIKSFADLRTQELYATGKAKRFPPNVAKRAARKLEYVELAARLDDLSVPPGNRLHALEGDRKGQYSISIRLLAKVLNPSIQNPKSKIQN
jgi:proteic killer suppression protein